MGSLPAAPPGGSGAEEGEGRGGDGSLEKELVVFLHVVRVPGMGGRLVTLMGQLGVGGGVGPGRGGWGGHRNFPEGSSKGKQREEGPSKGTEQRGGWPVPRAQVSARTELSPI